MEIKNYFLITVIILAFALISINLESLTGSTTRDGSSATIKVTPSSIKSGEKITINVVPGKEGVKNEVKIIKECNSIFGENCQGSRKAIIHLCSSNSYTINCKEPNYKSPITKTYQPSSGIGVGLYYVKITEYKKDDSGNYIERKAYFRVTEK